MAKFSGKIGYAINTKTGPGKAEDVITERHHRGDVLRNSRRLDNGDKVNNDISVGNSISIVADAYANQHFFAMRYIHWMGVRWYVDDVRVEHPRLVLRLGGVYSGPGPTAPIPDPPGGTP